MLHTEVCFMQRGEIKPGVVVATSGPGVTNLVTGIADAMMDSLPLVILTGQVHSQVIGTDAFQEADIVGITTPITKQNYQVKRIEDLPRIVKEAFHIATSGRPGPVLVDIPKDLTARQTALLQPVEVNPPGYPIGDLAKSVKIGEAMEILMDKVHQTPLKQSATLNYLTNTNVYIKLENLQKTGSFKLRGAMNKILSLTEQEAKNGVLAATAGNHAQGVALAASLRGIKSKIFMPKHTPLSKVAATREYGAETVLVGDTYHESYQAAVEDITHNGGIFVHAVDDDRVIAGQGTIGLEILQQNSQLDVIFVPIGGGGLISGIALAVKAINPSIKVIGVQASGASATYHKFTGQKMQPILSFNTIADGILVKEPGLITYPIIEKYVDDIVTVTDEEIAHAIMFMLEREKMLVEGAGAAALAAILYKKVPICRKNVGCIISGGNVDPDKIQTYREISKTTIKQYKTIL